MGKDDCVHKMKCNLNNISEPDYIKAIIYGHFVNDARTKHGQTNRQVSPHLRIAPSSHRCVRFTSGAYIQNRVRHLTDRLSTRVSTIVLDSSHSNSQP